MREAVRLCKEALHKAVQGMLQKQNGRCWPILHQNWLLTYALMSQKPDLSVWAACLRMHLFVCVLGFCVCAFGVASLSIGVPALQGFW